MPLTTLLEEALEAWEYTRAGLIDEVKNLSDAEMLFRPHAKSRSVAELVVHIAESGLVMAGELTRPDGDFTRKPYPQFIKEYAGGLSSPEKKGPLVTLLKRTQADGARKIRAAGEVFLLQQ